MATNPGPWVIEDSDEESKRAEAEGKWEPPADEPPADAEPTAGGASSGAAVGTESEFILPLRKKRRAALEAATITSGVQGEPAVAETKTEPPTYCDQHAVLEAHVFC